MGTQLLVIRVKVILNVNLKTSFYFKFSKRNIIARSNQGHFEAETNLEIEFYVDSDRVQVLKTFINNNLFSITDGFTVNYCYIERSTTPVEIRLKFENLTSERREHVGPALQVTVDLHFQQLIVKLSQTGNIFNLFRLRFYVLLCG